MKTTKKLLPTLLAIIILFGVVSIVANAVSISTTTSNCGYMIATDAKISKTVSTVKLYGNYDYLNFYINSSCNDRYFFYEIYSDKKMTKLVASDYTYCSESGTYSWSPMLTLKGVFKTGTYYGVTYAAKIDNSGNATISETSVTTFKLSVNRSPKFNQNIVVLKSVTNTVNGPTIKWQKLSNDTTKYLIYRRSMSGTKWTRVGTVNGSTFSFTDKSVKNKNGKYVYTVKAQNKSNTATRYLYNGLKCLFAKTPTVTSVSTTSDNRIQVKWTNTSNSACYRVYRSENGGNWKLLDSRYEGTTYYDKTTQNGKNYKYTVRAVIPTPDGDAVSAYHNVNKTVDFVGAPKLNPVAVAENGLKITWSNVSGANAYTVYRKTFEKGASWVNLGKVSGDITEFTDTTANSESSFIYTVRAEGKTSRGSYVNAGVEYIKLVAPKITDVQVSDSGFCIYWDNVAGATGYEIMQKNEDGSWSVYIDVGAETNCFIYCYSYKKLELSVRAIKGDEKGPFSTDSTVVTFIPQMTSYNEVYTDYTKISWSSISADEYRVYRKNLENENSEFELLYAGKETSCIDTDVEYDVTYLYEVRPVFDSVEEKEKMTVQHIKKESIDKYIKSVNVIQKFGDDYPVDYSNYAGYKFEYDVTDSYKDKVIYLYALLDDGEYELISSRLDDMTTEELYSDGFYIVVRDYISSIATTPIDAYNIKPQSEKCENVSVVGYSLQNDGIKVTWNSVENATKYIIQRWDLGVCYETEVVATDTEECSVVIPKDKITVFAPINLRIIAVHENGNETCSYYWDKINIYPHPGIYEIRSTTNGIKIHWWGYDSNLDDYYYVFRKAEGETKWTKIGQVKSKGSEDDNYSYTDKNVTSGKKYTYTVRCYDPVRGGYSSYYNTKGYSAVAK